MKSQKFLQSWCSRECWQVRTEEALSEIGILQEAYVCSSAQYPVLKLGFETLEGEPDVDSEDLSLLKAVEDAVGHHHTLIPEGRPGDLVACLYPCRMQRHIAILFGADEKDVLEVLQGIGLAQLTQKTRVEFQAILQAQLPYG